MPVDVAELASRATRTAWPVPTLLGLEDGRDVGGDCGEVVAHLVGAVPDHDDVRSGAAQLRAPRRSRT